MAPLTKGRVFGLVVALALVGVGLLWTLQGLGYVEGTFTNSRSWSLIGPGTAGLGVALAVVVLQRRE